jgi:hypothetical protein
MRENSSKFLIAVERFISVFHTLSEPKMRAVMLRLTRGMTRW